MTSPTSGTYTPPPARGSCPTGKVQFANGEVDKDAWLRAKGEGA